MDKSKKKQKITEGLGVTSIELAKAHSAFKRYIDEHEIGSGLFQVEEMDFMNYLDEISGEEKLKRLIAFRMGVYIGKNLITDDSNKNGESSNG